MNSEQTSRPVCNDCGKLPARPNGRSVRGFQLWHKYCNSCANRNYRQRKSVDKVCSRCGFKSEDICQMCAVDGTTLCQNCNALRLKQKKRRQVLTVDATVNIWDIRL